MRCPFCQTMGSQVRDSRISDQGTCIRRRRVCIKCNSRFTTTEKTKIKELLVIKNDSSLQIFDRNKIARSILLAARKRPISENQIEQLIDKIVNEIEGCGENKITSKRIGYIIIGKLLEVDDVAYIRFVSVYMNFNDTGDFLKIIKELSETKKTDL